MAERVMLALGPFRFEMGQATYQSLAMSQSWRWPEQARIGHDAKLARGIQVGAQHKHAPVRKIRTGRRRRSLQQQAVKRLARFTPEQPDGT